MSVDADKEFTGAMDILLLKESRKRRRMRAWSDLRSSDYELSGSPLPMSEFGSKFTVELWDMFSSSESLNWGLFRPIDRGDIVTCRFTEGRGSMSLLIMDMQIDKLEPWMGKPKVITSEGHSIIFVVCPKSITIRR